MIINSSQSHGVKHLFLLTYCLFIISHNLFANIKAVDKQNILIVNSYHNGYSWSDEIMDGIKMVYEENENVELFIEYLDAKRYNTSEYFELKSEEFKLKFSNEMIDIILVNDDYAFDFVKAYRNDNLPGTPLVFAGVDNFVPDSVFKTELLYGIRGGKSIKGTVDLILSVHSDVENITFISDGTKTGENMLNTVRNMESIYTDRVNFAYLLNKNSDELLSALKALPRNSVLFWLVFIKDKDGKIFTIRESIKMISKTSNVPMYSAWGFNSGNGSLGGNIHSGFETGKLMAKIADEVLNSDSIQNISRFYEQPVLNVFDYEVMQRFNIGLNDIPLHSMVHNKPLTIIEKYKTYLLLSAAFIVILLLTILYLVINKIKRRKAEAALQKAHQELEFRVADRTRELLSANFELEKLNATKDKFFSIIAHDLRGPLGNLYQLGELLSTDQNKLGKSEVDELIDMLAEGAKNSFVLVDNLLCWAKSNSAQMPINPKTIDLKDIVDENVKLLNLSAQSKNIKINNDVINDPKIVADPDMIHVVLRNLLSNAIKFSMPGGVVKIACERQDEKWVNLIVKDDGVGMSNKVIEKLFNSENNYSSVGTNQEKGSGLGLNLCYEFVTKNKGLINIESEEGKGTKMIVSLPV